MPQQAKCTVLFRLFACLLLLGTQTWSNGLRAAHLPTAIFELGALPSEVEDHNEGPHHVRGPGIAEVTSWTWQSALWPCAAPASYEPGLGCGSLSLLPVTGLQPSAP